MGQRLPSLSNAGLGLAAEGFDKYAQAGQIRAQGTAALGAGIAQGIAQITTNILRKKEHAREDAIRKDAIARDDKRYAQSRADRDTDRQDRRDEFFLRSTEGKKAELAERMRAGDASAATEWAENEATARTLTERLMGSRQAKAATTQMSDSQLVASLPASTWNDGKAYCPT